MEYIDVFLNDYRDFIIETNENMKYFADELNHIVSEDFKGDFEAFMKEKVLNEDYGSLRDSISDLYNNEGIVEAYESFI